MGEKDTIGDMYKRFTPYFKIDAVRYPSIDGVTRVFEVLGYTMWRCSHCHITVFNLDRICPIIPEIV